MKIAIASGKGGTGKTLISTNLFYALNQNKHQVTLVDCDAEEPNVLGFFKGQLLASFEVSQKVPVIDTNQCTYCGKCYEYCNYSAIFILPEIKVIRVIEDLCHGCGACSVACDFGAIIEKDVSLGTVSCIDVGARGSIIEARMKVGVYSPVSVIKSAIKEARIDGIVLMDSPPGTSCPFIQTVANADYVILVTEPTPFGLSDLKQSVETLRTMNKPCGVIVNRAGLGDSAVYQYLKQENISLLMEIPFDRDIAAIYSRGELVAKYRKDWMDELVAMYESINDQYGNCGHQR
jgi:MinD superfamily P-loop ATPase